MSKVWTLIGPDGKSYASAVPGTLGGHRRSHIYGRLDCPAARRAIVRGGYVPFRVFFLTEEDAMAAGYRPCAVCLPGIYVAWKAEQGDGSRTGISLAQRHKRVKRGEAPGTLE